MVTEEALAKRKVALEGDPGTDNAVKVDMPQKSFRAPGTACETASGAVETRVGIS